jgi:hypothetical protein
MESENKEHLQSPRPIETIFADFLDEEPKPVAAFVPVDADEQREAFLRGEVDNPHHVYDRLVEIDFKKREQKIAALSAELLGHTDISSKHVEVYETFVENYQKKTDFLKAAQRLNTEEMSNEERTEVERRFMELNVELYGEPDKQVYEGLISETRTSVKDKELTGKAEQIRQELLAMLPETPAAERYKPSNETVARTQELANSFYENMLRHIPEDKDIFGPEELADVFRDIIREEFGESAEDWRIEVTKAASVNVIAGEKLIKVPENRKPVSKKELQGLVAHEVGVHMLRAVMGEQTDLLPLRTGLPDYYDAEEGLGKVMEQAVKGKYADSGIPYYMIAGLMYNDHKNFRETFEIMWRYNALKTLKTEDVTDEEIGKAKNTAYKSVMRIARGTDTLPWFKDLAYYNGAEKMWRHMEEASDDYELFQFVLLGKGDAANKQHEHIMYETKTV